MNEVFWLEFGVLFVAALLGSAAVLPYGLRLAQNKTLKYSRSTILLLSIIQSIVIFGIVIWLGIKTAHAIGLGAPYVEALLNRAAFPSSGGLVVGLLLGVLSGAVLLVADLFFLPYWPQALRDTTLNTTLLENFLASFYGGINEELLIRFFGLSAVVWLFSFVWSPDAIIFWVANIIMTILFGLGHLPSLKGVIGSLPPLMVVRSLVLNAPIGLLCGWLFWVYGIEAAMLAHFCADIIYHVVGTSVLRRKLGL